MGTGSSLRERQRERTRDDTVRAAIGLISAGGIDGATIDGILAEVGMARGTLYAHYPAGLDEIVRAAYDRVGADLLAVARSRAGGRAEWTDRVAAYAEAMVELAQDSELGFFYNVSGPGRVGPRHDSAAGSEQTREAFRAELDAAHAVGELAGDLDTRATSALLVGMLRQAGIDVARDSTLGTSYIVAFRRTLKSFAR